MLSPAEEKIRTLATSFKQCYVIVIFACCRELYSIKHHSDCIEAKSVADAFEKFKQLKEEKVTNECRGRCSDKPLLFVRATFGALFYGPALLRKLESSFLIPSTYLTSNPLPSTQQHKKSDTNQTL